MVHGTRLHRKNFGDELEKRVPYPTPEPEPDPGLVGDLVNGVGSIAENAVDGVASVANNAVSGVVGLVTTVLGDVNRLIAPPKTTATVPATKTSSSSSVKATTTAATAPSVSSSPASGGNNGGSTGGNTGGSTGGNTGGNSGGNTGGSSGGSSGNSGGSNPDSSGGNGSSNDSHSNGSTPDSTNGNGSPNGVPGASSATGGSGTASENAAGSQSTGIVSGGVTPTAPASGTGVLNVAEGNATASGTWANATPVINAVGSVDNDNGGSDSASDITLSSGGRATATLRGNSPTSSSTGSSGPGSGGNGGSSDTPSENSNVGLSPGVIAAIVVVCSLALLAFIIFLLRKWYRSRRARRLENWATGPGAFSFFGSGNVVNVNREKDEKSVDPAMSGSGLGLGTRSARSSFGTTYDQGLRPLTADPFGVSASDFSDLFSATNTSMTFRTPSPIPGFVPPTVQRPENAVDRQSLISIASSNSNGGNRDGNTGTEVVAESRENSADGHAQYLDVPETQEQDSHNRPQLSPISVRPWSPSERWAFPQPPVATAQPQNAIFYEPPASPKFKASIPRSASEALKGHDTFSWMTAMQYQSSQSERTPASDLPLLSPMGQGASAERDPFADPTHTTTDALRTSVIPAASGSAVTAETSTSGTDGFVGTVEHVRRPFVPTLVDELSVHRGDVIRVLQVFDDGWVQVEKLPNGTDANIASGTGMEPPVNERGLIPVDCLREAGEALPTFLASRRVSSYYGGVAL